MAGALTLLGSALLLLTPTIVARCKQQQRPAPSPTPSSVAHWYGHDDLGRQRACDGGAQPGATEAAPGQEWEETPDVNPEGSAAEVQAARGGAVEGSDGAGHASHSLRLDRGRGRHGKDAAGHGHGDRGRRTEGAQIQPFGLLMALHPGLKTHPKCVFRWSLTAESRRSFSALRCASRGRRCPVDVDARCSVGSTHHCENERHFPETNLPCHARDTQRQNASRGCWTVLDVRVLGAQP